MAAIFLAYQPAWNGLPVWDDGDHITHVDLRSLHGLARIWTEVGAAPQYYPILHTTFWIEHKLWGDSPLGYHLVNIFLHAASALILLKILRQLNVPGAWVAVAIFALHPLQVESVAWISELKNALSGTFCLLAALAYLKFAQDRHRRFYIFAFVFFLLGLMTKSVIATLPVVLLVIFWWQRGTLTWKRDVNPLIPFFAAGIGYGLLTAWIERKICKAEGALFDFSFAERLLLAGRAFWFYLGKIFWPVDLRVIYPRWEISHAVWWQYLFPIAAMALAIVLWVVRKRSRAPLAGLLIFAAMLFPMLGFLNIAFFAVSFVSDHYPYLASIGVITVVAAGATTMGAKLRFNKIFIHGIGIALLVLLFCRTWQHAGIFRNGETFYSAILSQNPNVPTAHNNLGGILVEQGRIDEAIAHYETALAIQPDYQFGRFGLAAALLQKGAVEEATRHLQKLIEINPDHAKANYSLGNIAAQKRDVDLAATYYERAIRTEPNFADAHGALGNALLQKGETDAAIAEYQTAISLRPENATAHYNIATAFARQRRWDDAIAHLQVALQIDPNYPDARDLLNQAMSERSPR